MPSEFGFNTWKIALVDATTMGPAPNARLTWQCAYMSVHGHGSNPKSIENLGNGEYKLVDMNMRMLGPWEVRLGRSDGADARVQADLQSDQRHGMHSEHRTAE